MGKYKIIKCLSVVFVFLMISQSYAQNVQIKSQGYSNLKRINSAKKDIINKVIKSVSKEQIIQTIGKEKYQRNINLIEKEVIKKSGIYVPLIKTGEISSDNTGVFTMPVTLTLSPRSLRQMLLKHGLLYKSEERPKTLPFVVFRDRVNGAEFRWWESAESSYEKNLVKSSKLTELALSQEFGKKGFIIKKPVINNMDKKISSEVKKSRLSSSDYITIGRELESEVAIQGKIIFELNDELPGSYLIKLDWKAVSINNDRSFANVIKTEITEVAEFEKVIFKSLRKVLISSSAELSRQMYSTWKSGVLGSSIFKVVVEGNVDYKLVESLKTELVKEAKYIKRVRERVFTPQGVTLNVDSSGNISDLIEIVKNIDLKEWRLKSTRFSGESAYFSMIPK